jgi:hypothetical protein
VRKTRQRALKADFALRRGRDPQRTDWSKPGYYRVSEWRRLKKTSRKQSAAARAELTRQAAHLRGAKDL